LTPNFRRRFAVASKLGLTVNFEAVHRFTSIHAGLRAVAALLAADGKSNELLDRNRSFKHFCLAIFDVRGRAPTMIAPRSVVDRWNYIIKELSVTASNDRVSAICA
jgi:hypothetical protein